VILAIVALVGLGAILSALEEPTGETAASPRRAIPCDIRDADSDNPDAECGARRRSPGRWDTP